MELLANHAFFNNNSNNNNHPSNNLFALNLLNNNKYMHSRIGGDSPKTPVMSTPSSPVNSHYNAAISTLGWNRDKVVGESVILNPILSQFISNQSFQERHQQLLFQHQQRLQQQQQQQQQQQSLIKQQMPPSLEVVGESRKRSREGSIHLLDEKTIANSILDESASASTNGATTDVVESPTNSNSSSKRQRKLNKKVLSVLESSSTDDEESASSSSPKQVINKDRASNKSSLYCGVSKCIKDGRWQARIRVGKEVKYLGRFQTEEMAARSYDAAFIIVHGKEAEGLNFKDSIQMFDEEFMKERCKTLTATEDPLQIALASCIRLKSPSINIDFNNNANINIAKSMNDKQIQENGSIPMKRKYTKRINNKVNLTPALVLPGPAISSATTILSIENESPKMETPTNKIKTSSTLTTTIDIENPMMVILESASTNDIMAAYDLLILKQINFRS